MKKITNEQIHLAYELSKKVLIGTLSTADAGRELTSRSGMGQGSSYGYISTILKIRSGQRYRRTINAYATDYVLGSIEKDYGREALRIAVDAVSAHTSYYENKTKSRPTTNLKIIKKYRDRIAGDRNVEEINEDFEIRVKSSIALGAKERGTRLKEAYTIPQKTLALTTVYIRNPDVVAEVLQRASGTCERCKEPAPFIRKKDGTPYLEVHHKIQLSKGGEDTVTNALALCPNCHRELHFGQ